jgi:hypothetical protein
VVTHIKIAVKKKNYESEISMISITGIPESEACVVSIGEQVPALR